VKHHIAKLFSNLGDLCDAFRDYPIMRFVLGEPTADDAARLAILIGFAVASRALRDEPIFGIEDGPELAAAIMVSYYGLQRRAWQQGGADK